MLWRCSKRRAAAGAAAVLKRAQSFQKLAGQSRPVTGPLDPCSCVTLASRSWCRLCVWAPTAQSVTAIGARQRVLCGSDGYRGRGD
jgi:hypothetical protein